MGDTLEFRVWTEGSDLVGTYDTKAEAVAAIALEAQRCPCGTDGQEATPGKGNFTCGALSPHGLHIQIIEDGVDVTSSDYGQWD